MKPAWGQCVFRSRPTGCKFGISESEAGGCAASGWEIVNCYIEHYGDLLADDGGLRLIEEFLHLVIDNDSAVEEK